MKVHTRAKRNLGMNSHFKHTKKVKTSVGAKTFKNEESAKKYAEKMGIKDYDLVNLKSEENKIKKLKIVKK
ncbi:MAG: hypothetical protein KJ674_03110 [Nanoarchaeota archaeon]|nr:hypothetical protein [Nanoarchaeota archaeon]